MTQALSSSVAATFAVTRPSAPATVFIDVESAGPEISNTDIMVAETLSTSNQSLYMTTAVPVRKDGHLSTIATSRKKRRLKAATATATAIVKRKNFLGVTNVTKQLHLSSVATVAQIALLEAM